VTIENMIVTLNRLPEIKAVVDTGTDLVTLFGFLLTAIAVLAGAGVSAFIYKGTASNQMTLAKAVAIKESRQAWINELRDTCADYVAAICTMQIHTESDGNNKEFIQIVNSRDPSGAAAFVDSWGAEKRTLMMSVFSLGAKIQLLANPGEPVFQELLAAVQRAADEVSISKGGAAKACEEIISLTQRILKAEWERAKRME